MAGLMKIANRPVRELMTPRTELDWIDKDADPGRDPRGDRGFAAFADCRWRTVRPTR